MSSSVLPPQVPSLRRRARRDGRDAWRLGAVAVIWATSLVIAALWVSGGGVAALIAHDAESLNTIGRLTGLVAANLMLYQVLLMARVPLFERGFGRAGMTRMHRLVGFWSFWLMLAHIVFQTLGYAAAQGVNGFVQLWQFVWDYPGMLLATAGTLLLIAVVVLSLRRVRAPMRYESWHLLHLYGYLGVGLVVPHMIWTGADFDGSVLASAYWWTLWVTTAAAVIVFRIIRPVSRSLALDLRVAAVERDGARGVTVRVRGRGVQRLGVLPGQFFVWRFVDGPGWMRGHPFSVSSAPSGDALTLSAQLVGDGTARLTRLRKGTRVLVEGPFGTMTGASRTGGHLLMIGAGAGIAPLVSLLESEPYAPGEATLITRDHSAEHGMRRDAIAHLVATRGLRHADLPGPRSPAGSPWLPETHSAWAGDQLIRWLVADPADCDAYICGPDGWMAAVGADLTAAGVSDRRIHTESFTT
ncbi:ferric reductase-like transmembrane domain-containing protein [Microbacterium sp.]|uniref:ferredoxin reductase family protein n=1 Tax=Microbacterium sp. TaxID=51671 RepID=UPI003A8D403F